jgi:hypothetical protein
METAMKAGQITPDINGFACDCFAILDKMHGNQVIERICSDVDAILLP